MHCLFNSTKAVSCLKGCYRGLSLFSVLVNANQKSQENREQGINTVFCRNIVFNCRVWYSRVGISQETPRIAMEKCTLSLSICLLRFKAVNQSCDSNTQYAFIKRPLSTKRQPVNTYYLVWQNIVFLSLFFSLLLKETIFVATFFCLFLTLMFSAIFFTAL